MKCGAVRLVGGHGNVAPPRGGRGLKSDGIITAKNGVVSPPSRGAWIEIAFLVRTQPRPRVAPLAGGVD